MNRYAGIVYLSLDDHHVRHLPLQEADMRVWMVDGSARVVLSQVFENVSESPTTRAKYVFSLPASAAVCAFELEHADGRVIVGFAKEKSEATQGFRSALDAGKTAGLVESETDDTFTISVGSIPARKKVTARLTFVMDLLNEGRRDHVHLQLPMAIAARHGEAPAPCSMRPQLMKGRIHSPTHPVSLLRYKTRSGQQSERRMTAIWSSTTFLDQDFVLTVHALGLDEPRCFAEVDPQRADTIAMQLSFVPKFKMPRVPSQEYIFVFDRSTSMNGAPMETAKRTLELLLHLLPDSDTTFNIFGCASEVGGLWDTSLSFNEATMQYAISNIQAMQANSNGTEFAKALQLAVASRNRDRPTVMFVLTDGDIRVGVGHTLQREGIFGRCRRVVTQVLSRAKCSRPSYDSDSSANLDLFEVISAAVNSCKPDAPLRVFALGIGEHVSSATCKRLAREGGGECLFAVQAEDIIGKCARLLNAGQTRVIESVTVDWHGSGNSQAVNFSLSNHHHPLPSSIVQLEPPPPVQQVPHMITKIFPGMRFNIFAITTFRSIPRQVRLRAKVEGLAKILELVVPVMEVKQPCKDESSIPLLHTLAARELIKHLAEGKALLPKPMAPTSNQEVRKAAIVRLGLEYQLASQYTAFLSSESQRETARRRLHHSTSWQRSRYRRSYVSPPSSVASDTPEVHALRTDVTTVQTALDNLSHMVSAVFSFFSDTAPTNPRHQRPLPGTYYSTAQSRSGSLLSESGPSFQHDNSSTATFSTLSSLEGSSTNSQWSIPVSPLEDPIQRVPSPVFNRIRNVGLKARLPGHVAQPHTSGPRPPPVPKEVYALILLQRHDGSFTPSAELGALVGVEMLGKAADLQVDGNIWATAVVVAYLKYHLGAQLDLLHVLLSKSLDYVEGRGASLLVGRDFFDLVAIAGQSVG